MLGHHFSLKIIIETFPKPTQSNWHIFGHIATYPVLFKLLYVLSSRPIILTQIMPLIQQFALMRHGEVLFIELCLHFFSKSYRWLEGLKKVIYNTIPMEFCSLSTSFILANLNFLSLDNSYHSKKMLHLLHPIIVDLRVPNTMKGRASTLICLADLFIVSIVLPIKRTLSIIIISSIIGIILFIPVF